MGDTRDKVGGGGGSRCMWVEDEEGRSEGELPLGASEISVKLFVFAF